MHTITIDYREAELLKKCQAFLELANLNLPAGSPRLPLAVEASNLPLGDVIISGEIPPSAITAAMKASMQDPTVSVVAQKIIFERKTLQDLANSIRDGRYAEQSFRLNACSVPNHHVIYIVEGDLRYYRPYKTNIDKRSLLSAMVSISYYKGFSLYRSLTLDETAEFILQMAAKIARRPQERAYYATGGSASVNSCANPSCNGACQSYANVHNGQVKKNNITPTNIGEIMLAQIPGVSSASSIVIMARYKTIPALLVAMQANPTTVFEDLYVVNKTGQRRRLNKTCKLNLFSFLHGGYTPPTDGDEHLSEEDSGHSEDELEFERERDRRSATEIDVAEAEAEANSVASKAAVTTVPSEATTVSTEATTVNVPPQATVVVKKVRAKAVKKVKEDGANAVVGANEVVEANVGANEGAGAKEKVVKVRKPRAKSSVN